MTPDPFWTATAPGQWHGDAATAPMLRLLIKTSSRASDDHDLSYLHASKLKAFVSAAADVDALIDGWESEIEATSTEQDPIRRCEQRDSAIRSTIDHTDGITTDEFRHILQVALCDQELAQELCHLFERRSRQH